MAAARTSKDFCTVMFTLCSECCDVLELSQGKLTFSLDLQPFADELVILCNTEVKKSATFLSIEAKQRK